MYRSENYLEVVLVVLLLYRCIVFGYQWRRYRCIHWEWQYSAFTPSCLLLLLPCTNLNNLCYSTLSARYYLIKYHNIFFNIPVSNVQLSWAHIFNYHIYKLYHTYITYSNNLFQIHIPQKISSNADVPTSREFLRDTNSTVWRRKCRLMLIEDHKTSWIIRNHITMSFFGIKF